MNSLFDPNCCQPNQTQVSLPKLFQIVAMWLLFSTDENVWSWSRLVSYQSEIVSSKWELPFLPPSSLELLRKERAWRHLSFWWALNLIGHYGMCLLWILQPLVWPNAVRLLQALSRKSKNFGSRFRFCLGNYQNRLNSPIENYEAEINTGQISNILQKVPKCVTFGTRDHWGSTTNMFVAYLIIMTVRLTMFW